MSYDRLRFMFPVLCCHFIPFLLSPLLFPLLFPFLLTTSFGMIISSAASVWPQTEGLSITLFFLHSTSLAILCDLVICLSFLLYVAFWWFWWWGLVLGKAFCCLFVLFLSYVPNCPWECSVGELLSILCLSVSPHNGNMKLLHIFVQSPAVSLQFLNDEDFNWTILEFSFFV